MLNKLLAPLDGTPLAEAGFLWAEKAAQRSGAAIHLLTVVDPTLSDFETHYKQAEAYLQSRRDQLKNKGLTVKMEVAAGEPAQTILERAENVDLTVVSSGTVRWLISAVLDRVLEKMTRPIVVVRASAIQPTVPELDRILVAVDRSDYSGDILPVIQGLAKAFQASVTVCHAVPPLTDTYGRQTHTHATSAAASIHEANLFVARAAKRLQDEGIEIETIGRQHGQRRPPFDAAALPPHSPRPYQHRFRRRPLRHHFTLIATRLPTRRCAILTATRPEAVAVSAGAKH